jgi:hypothetical protein
MQAGKFVRNRSGWRDEARAMGKETTKEKTTPDKKSGSLADKGATPGPKRTTKLKVPLRVRLLEVTELPDPKGYKTQLKINAGSKNGVGAGMTVRLAGLNRPGATFTVTKFDDDFIWAVVAIPDSWIREWHAKPGSVAVIGE